MLALSIRQPWAWLIVNGHKDIENRDWPTRFRGPVLIHASKGMTHDEYEECEHTCLLISRGKPPEDGITLPNFAVLERGGIVGQADIIDCVSHEMSPWFFGFYGFVIRNARPLPFRPFKGMLGFFEVPN